MIVCGCCTGVGLVLLEKAWQVSNNVMGTQFSDACRDSGVVVIGRVYRVVNFLHQYLFLCYKHTAKSFDKRDIPCPGWV